MLFSTTLLASIVSLALAAPSTPKVVTFPVTKHHRDSKFAQAHLHTRQTPVSIANQQDYYSIALGLGTPVQNFNVLLDTGSSDLWVYNVTDTNDCKKAAVLSLVSTTTLCPVLTSSSTTTTPFITCLEAPTATGELRR